MSGGGYGFLVSDAGSEQSASPSAGTADWFRSLADYAAVLVWAADARGNVTYLNSYWLSFTGRPEATQLGSGWIEAVHPDDRPAMLRDFAKAFAQRRRFRLWYRLRHADGDYRWIEDNAAPRYDAAGEFLGYVGVCADITEYREAARDIVRHADPLSRLRPARSRGGRWLFEWDPTTDALRFPGSDTAPFGHSRDRVRTLADWYECIHPEDRALLRTQMQQYLAHAGGTVDEYRILTPSGDVVHALATVVLRRDADGRSLDAVGLVFDVTEDRRREIALEMQAAVLDRLSEAVTVCDDRGRILLTNRACDEMFRYPPGDLIGQHVRVLSGGSDQRATELLEDMRARAEREGKWSGEVPSVRRNGTPFTSRLTCTYATIAGQRWWVLTRQDATDQKRLETAILEANQYEQSRVASELHDGLGQELVGLSMSLQAEAQRLQAVQPDSAGRLSALVDDVKRAIGLCRDLAEGVSAFALGDGGLEVALERLAVRESRIWSGACAVRVAPGAAAGLRPEQSYELFRIAQEAVRNGFRHGGARHVTLTLARDADALELRIEDDGAGFDLDTPATGLGLKIMRFRASQAGGLLTVRSVAGRGTVVTCRL